VLLVTQPGWDVTVIAELRAQGVPGRFPVRHRGSSVLVPDLRRTGPAALSTPASVYRVLLDGAATPGGDAIAALLGALRSVAVKEPIVEALQGSARRGLRRYSIATELYGRTGANRKQLTTAVEREIQTAFPRWKRSPEAGARFLCKADTEYAVLALQTATNLSADQGLRAGSLREHLAASLLVLARATGATAIFDPFMGTGTILKVAAQRFGARHCFGLEASPDAFQLARSRLAGKSATLFNTRLEEFDLERLPATARLVSNIPFGHRFARTPSRRLVELIHEPPFADSPMALLMSREQALEVAAATGLQARNVLVLGRPAAILYGSPTGQFSRSRTRRRRISMS
jgi:hypothetical protein